MPENFITEGRLAKPLRNAKGANILSPLRNPPPPCGPKNSRLRQFPEAGFPNFKHPNPGIGQ